jgi:glycosyltransferase involved in cell wall biosynthesis
MRPVIAKATVSVVPLRIGGGTRWKILEAAAMAKAVVSTRVGAEGLDFREEDEILLADEPLAFADAVLALVADPVRRKTLGRAARKRVEGQYTFQTLRTAVEEAFGQLRFRH